MSTAARTNILNKIKMALAKPTPLPFPGLPAQFPIQPSTHDIIVEFAEQFTALQGKFTFCANGEDLRQQFAMLCVQNQWTKIYSEEEATQKELPISSYKDIASCEAAVTSCEALVARTGTIVLSAQANNRIPSVYAPIHICIGFTSQLVYDIKDALEGLQEKYAQNLPSLISFASGPSRTADIEKTLCTWTQRSILLPG
jgi:L-lactate dehydrogenase complex protein LldG